MNIDEIDWTEYHPFVPGGPAKPHREMTRGEARESFEWFMDQRHERIGQLESLLDRNDVQFSNDVSGLMALEEFFVTHVEPSDEEPTAVANRWHAVALDISVFLTEQAIARCSGLHWELFVWGKKNVSYQRPVLMGFGLEENLRYNHDINRIVMQYAHRLVVLDDRIPEWLFVKVLQGIEQMWAENRSV